MTELKTNAKTVHGRYMNLRNDWGFKHIFGKEAYLIDFLNALLQGKEKIRKITYLPTERLGKTEEDRKAIFDIYCRNSRGELILLEMQNASQEYFHERSIFYSAHLIQSQAPKGKWNYKLKKIYVIGILNFNLFPEEDGSYIERAVLVRERTKECLSNTLVFTYIELPKFRKEVEELETALDGWLYTIKHSKKLASQPPTIKGKLFDELYKDIELNRLTTEDMAVYGKSDLQYEDFPTYTSYAKKVGRQEGRKEGLLKGRREGILTGEKRGILKGRKEGLLKGRLTAIWEMAGKLLQMGMGVDDIAKATGLTPAQIREIKIG